MSSLSSALEDDAKTESPSEVSSSATSWPVEDSDQEFGLSVLDRTWPLEWDDRAGRVRADSYDDMTCLC